MTDEENFLTRWARRKRAARRSAPPPRPEDRQAGAAPTEDRPMPADAAAAQDNTAQLPPIETIGADSDIRAFLAAGVPPDLTRAALRRAWSSDPVIRDFVGPSENSWDFTAAGGVPGFGQLTADEAHRLLDRLTAKPGAIDPAAPVATTRPSDQGTSPMTAADESQGSAPGKGVSPERA